MMIIIIITKTKISKKVSVYLKSFKYNFNALWVCLDKNCFASKLLSIRMQMQWVIEVSRILESDWSRKSWACLTKTNWFWLDGNIFLEIYQKQELSWIYMGWVCKKKTKLQELSFKIISNKFNRKLFSKNLTSYMPFFNRYGPWFLYISSHMQKVEKIYIYIYIYIYILYIIYIIYNIYIYI